jgi:hypothetical protein
MATLLGLAAALAAALVLLFLAARSRGLRSAVFGVGRWAFRPLLAACRVVASISDFFLGPEGSARRIAWPRFVVWIVAGFAPLAAFAATIVEPPLLPVVFDGALAGWLLVAAAVFHLLMLSAALISIHDDFNIMDGIVTDDRRTIGGRRSVTRSSVVATSVAFFVVYAAAIVDWLGGVVHVALLDRGPGTGIAIVDDLLVVLWALPTAPILRLIDWLAGVDTRPVFAGTPLATTFAIGIYAVGSILIAGLAAAALKMIWQLRRIVHQLGEGRDADRPYLIARARLAPSVIKRGILNAAIGATDRHRQMRLIEASRDLTIFTFPQTFLHYVEGYDVDIQQLGLDRSLELFRQKSADYEREPSEAILRKAGRLLRRGKLAPESTKRLVRLATAVLTAKRGVVRVDEQWRDPMFAVINRELRKVGPDGDAALRGVLHDLRGAISRAVVVRPSSGPQASPVGRGAQPGSPATTAPQ